MMEGRKSIWSYIKGYKFRSLLVKNFLYVFILVTVPLLLVLTLNYGKFNEVINNRVMDMNEGLLNKNAVVTDNIMLGILDELDDMATMDAVVEIVRQTETDSAYYQQARATGRQIKERIFTNNFIKSAYIYSDVNQMLIQTNGVYHIDDVKNKGKWYMLHQQLPMDVPYILVNHANSIYFCQPICTLAGQRIGLFVMNVDLQKIRVLLESQNVAQQGIFFVVDSSGQTMYCNEQDYLLWDEDTVREYRKDIVSVKTGETELMTSDNNKRVVSVMESVHQSWRYAYVTEMPNYREETAAVSEFLFSSVLVGILASVIAAYIITYLTYRPMKKIMNVINNPQLHWSDKEASKASNELLYITSNIMADRNANLEISEELEERVRSLRQAQFRALQFQIDPHFLYNTLETIKWSAVEEIGLGNKTSKMLTKVARLYRLGLENDDVIITLGEELDFLKLYIEIVRIRFGDLIQFHWDIDESLYDCNVIKMCLQPIVENAINHGLRPNNYHGSITISAYYEADCLCISVANDGEGMSPAQMKALNEKLKTGAGFEESKVGLRNVNERIKLIYGRKYGVSISQDRADADQSSDVRVVLTFPCRKIYGSEETK